jgi:2-hydroxychromene-2-carboxylate isomerase
VKTIEYFLTPVSPWTYLGHQRLINIAQKHKAQIELIPIDLGANIFPQTGGLPLAQRAPQRQLYRLEELARWRDFLKMPLNVKPAFFPVSDALANEMIVAAQAISNGTKALEFSGKILRSVWVDELNVADKTLLLKLADACHIDCAALEAALPNSHAQLDVNNQRAMQANVFGAPWFKIGTDNFWGQDRLDFVERAVTV